MTGMREQRQRDAAGRIILLLATLAAFLLPLVWTALASFGLLPDNSRTPPSWTGPPTLDHFSEIGVAEPAFWQELATSTASAVCAAALTVGVSFLGAYGLARSNLIAGRMLTQGFLVLASLPVMAYVIPLSDVMRRVHLADTFAGMVLAEAAVTAPLAVFVLHGALAQLSPEWEEAAVLDGAGLFRVLGQVVLPLVAPSVAATAIVLFVVDWNMLLVPLVLTSGHVKTVPVAMSDFFTFERALDWPTAAAALIVSLAPLALLVAVFHRLLEHFNLGTSNVRDIG
jgi:ABC-type glycerol-3-phosphate transport system permease component